MRAISAATVRACRSIANELSGVGCAEDLPVNLVSLAHRLGVKAVRAADLTVDGYVGTASDGSFVIRYRRSNPHYRNRFTIAHEIAHVLLAEVTGVPVGARKARCGFDAEEVVANRLAAEILMPEAILRCELGRRSPSWGVVQALRKLFDVSAYALLRRITEITGVAGVFARFEADKEEITEWKLCDATSVPQLCLALPFEQIVRRAICDMESSRFTTSAYIADRWIEIPCELRLSGHVSQETSWAYGWTCL